MNNTVITFTHDLRDIQTQLAEDTAGFIAREEARYAHQIDRVADAIAKRHEPCRFIWMCGPSSVGKTTTAAKLCTALDARGIQAFVVSLDDFYRGVGQAPLLEDGTFDYESPLALDLPRLQRCLIELATDGETMLPRYDFSAGAPAKTRTHLRLNGNTAVLFEGIQAFSPLLTEGMKTPLPDNPLRLFINTCTRFTDGETMLLCRRDIRLSRRLLRDERTRNSDFSQTLSMWQKVLAGDERHIFPYSRDADLTIDTAIGYEPCVLAPLLLERLHTLYGTPYEATAKRLEKTYARFTPLSASFVPSDSVLREFVGTD